MSWTIRKGIQNWEIWNECEKYDERSLPFLKRAEPSSFETREALEAWLTQEEKKIAKSTSIRILARSNVPSQVLKSKLLMRGFSEKIADEMVVWAVERSYIQDMEYIRSAIRREMLKGYGPKAILWKLQSKKFPSDAIERELKEVLPLEVEVECAQKELAKMHVRSDFSLQKKAMAKLYRRGFSGDAIRTLKFGVFGKTREGNDVPDIFHSGDE